MAKKGKTSKEIVAIKTRLTGGKLEKTDVAYLVEIIDQSLALQRAIESAKVKSGGRVVISKLPFGLDLVK